MKLSKTAKTMLKYCWHEGEPRGIQVIIGHEHTTKCGYKFKFTEDILNEITQFNLDKNIYNIKRSNKIVTIIGAKGGDKDVA